MSRHHRPADPARPRRVAWLLLIVAVATACVVLRVPAGRQATTERRVHAPSPARPAVSAVAGSVSRESR